GLEFVLWPGKSEQFCDTQANQRVDNDRKQAGDFKHRLAIDRLTENAGKRCHEWGTYRIDEIGKGCAPVCAKKQKEEAQGEDGIDQANYEPGNPLSDYYS